MNKRRLADMLGGDAENEELSEGRLHLAFLLFVSGAVLLLAAAVLFVVAQVFPHTFDLSMRFVLRHVGGITGGVGATLLFVGIVAALSTRPYMRWLAIAGAVVSLVGVAGFGYAYPHHWGIGQDLSIPVIVTLTVGFAVMIGATFASTVSNLILRQRIRAELRDELGREPTDEEVRRDVEEALAMYDYTWGGTRVDRTKGLRISEEHVDQLEVHGWKFQESEDADTAGLDRSTQMLTALRGGVEKEGELELGGVDQKGAALKRLREGKAEAEANRPWNRFKAWLGRLWARLKAAIGIGETEADEAATGTDEAETGTDDGPEAP